MLANRQTKTEIILSMSEEDAQEFKTLLDFLENLNCEDLMNGEPPRFDKFSKITNKLNMALMALRIG